MIILNTNEAGKSTIKNNTNDITSPISSKKIDPEII